MKKRITKKSNRDRVVCIVCLYMIMYEFLPILQVVYHPILTLLRIFAAAVFYLCVLTTNLKFFMRFSCVTVIAFLVNLLAFYHCWSNYETIGDYMIDAIMCWVYMELGIFVVNFCSAATKETITRFIIIVVCLTSITSVITLQSVPTAVRELGNGSMHIKGMEASLYRRNTSTWGGLYGMVFLLPYLILRFKNKKRIFLLACIAIIGFCIFKSQLTTAIIISAVFLALIFIRNLTTKKMIAIGLLVISARSILMGVLSSLVEALYEAVKTDNSVMTLRLSQINILLKNNQMTGTISGRYDLYMSSFKAFLSHPIMGRNIRGESLFSSIGMHSQVFDLMGTVGIIGCIPLLIAYCYLIGIMLNSLKHNVNSSYYLFSIGMLTLLMFINPTWYAEAVYLSVFLGVILCFPTNSLSGLEKYKLEL